MRTTLSAPARSSARLDLPDDAQRAGPFPVGLTAGVAFALVALFAVGAPWFLVLPALVVGGALVARAVGRARPAPVAHTRGPAGDPLLDRLQDLHQRALNLEDDFGSIELAAAVQAALAQARDLREAEQATSAVDRVDRGLLERERDMAVARGDVAGARAREAALLDLQALSERREALRRALAEVALTADALDLALASAASHRTEIGDGAALRVHVNALRASTRELAGLTERPTLEADVARARRVLGQA